MINKMSKVGIKSRGGDSTDTQIDTNKKASIGSNRNNHRPRLDYIDNLRVLACFLVLLTHSTMPSTNPEKDGFWMFGISLLGSPSSELFLALSGTVLLPVKTGFRKFYKRRFLKLLPPLVIWSVLGTILYTYTRGVTWPEALNMIERIPLQPVIGVYWFVYAMVGLYLLAPYLSGWLRSSSKQQLEFFLVLWVINMIFPWIMFFFPNLTNAFNVNGNYYWQFCYFGGFLGYWLLGYYLRMNPIKISFNWKWIVLMLGTISYPLAIFILESNNHDTGPLLDNLQIGSAIWVACLYTIYQHFRFSAVIQKVLSHIAKYSFGIYLTHIYVRNMFWNMFESSQIHIFPRTFLIAFLVLITGYSLTYLLSKIPYGKYIAGT